MTTAIRNRVIGLRYVRASELVPNERNWRLHPERQSSALRALLDEVGFVGAVIARELPDGRLELIDGHLRRETAPDAELPVLVVDLDDAEAAKVLATFDPIGALAEIDQFKLDELFQNITSDNAELMGLIAQMSSKAPALGPELDEHLADGISLCTCPSCGHEHHCAK